MFQFAAISIATCVELLWLRQWLWGTFGAQRAMAMLRTETWSCLWGELTFFLILCAFAAISIFVSGSVLRSKPVEGDFKTALRFILALSLSFGITYAFAVAVNRVALGT